MCLAKSEIRISKFETIRGQNKLKIRKSKTSNPIWARLKHCICFHHFEFVSDFEIRASNFST